MNEILASITIGFLLGLGIAYLYVAHRIKNLLNNLDEHLDRAMDSFMIPAVVEKENGVYYCYQETDHKFLAQGSSLAELREIFKTTMPEKTVYINGGNPEAVEELRQEVASANKLSQ